MPTAGAFNCIMRDFVKLPMPQLLQLTRLPSSLRADAGISGDAPRSPPGGGGGGGRTAQTHIKFAFVSAFFIDIISKAMKLQSYMKIQ